jgi:hypothetical protein
MAIADVDLARRDEHGREMILGGKQHVDCFLCGGEIRRVMVYWSGLAGEGENNLVHLHPACAQRLARHLITDSMHAERIVQNKPVDGGIGIPHIVLSARDRLATAPSADPPNFSAVKGRKP